MCLRSGKTIGIVLTVLFLFSGSKEVIAEVRPVVTAKEKKAKLLNSRDLRLERRTINYKYHPVAYEIHNFDTKQSNKYQSREELVVEPENEEGPPWIESELIKKKNQKSKKNLRLTYNVAKGKVRYEMKFRRPIRFQNKSKRPNSIGFDLRGRPAKINVILDYGDYQTIFELKKVPSEWEELIFPFEAFDGYDPDSRSFIRGISFEIIGVEQDSPEGRLDLDNLKFYRISDYDMPALLERLEEIRLPEQENFIASLFKARQAF